MIEGFKLHFKSDELSAHFRKKADGNDQKADKYEAELSKLRDMTEEEWQQTVMYTVSNSPLKSFKATHQQNIRNLRRSAAKNRLMADHLPEGETFVLSLEDLRNLELVDWES